MKKILVLFIVILITGCSVNYEIEITNGLKVIERCSLEAGEDVYKSHYQTTKVKVLQDILNIYNDELKKNNYQVEVIKDELPYVKIAREYSSIQEYLNSSLLFNNYFDKINYTKDGKIVKIETEGFNPNEHEDPDRFYVDDLDIAIKSAYKVVNSNATKIDKKTNTYHFELKGEEEEFKIMLEIDTSRKFIANLDVYIVLFIVLILTIAAWIFVYVNKKKNNY